MLHTPSLFYQQVPGFPPSFRRSFLIRKQAAKAGSRQTVVSRVQVELGLERRIPRRQQGIESVEDLSFLIDRCAARQLAQETHHGHRGEARRRVILLR